MSKGHPKKPSVCNISGLRNQKRARSPSPPSCHSPASPKKHHGTVLDADEDDDAWVPFLAANGDSMKVVGYDSTVVAADGGVEETDECDEEWDNNLENDVF